MKYFGMMFAAMLSLCGCTQFPTRYDRIEPDAVRAIGFVYEPCAEGAPGDTMRVRAYFAGEPVVSVKWQLSYSHIINVYGRDTIVDIFDFTPISVSPYLPDSVEIAFVIPDSTFFKTRAITQSRLDLLKKTLPSAMASMSRQDLATLMHDLGSLNFQDITAISAFLQQWGPRIGITTVDKPGLDSLMGVAAKLTGFFSVPAVLFANVVSDNGDKLRIKGDFSIRYNRRFQNTPVGALFPVNRNPGMHWIGVYKVNDASAKTFAPWDKKFAGKFTLSYLYNDLFPDSVNDTVVIEKGYAYFIAADSGIVSYTRNDTVVCDTSRDRYWYRDPRTGRDTFELETYFYDWQYQNLALDSVTQPLDSLFMLATGAQQEGGRQPSIIKMLPSIDKKMTRARIWTTVYDELIGEYNRPSGFTVRITEIYFKYL